MNPLTVIRLRRRGLSPPALSASEDAERQIIHHKSASQSATYVPSSTSPHSRRSRMSMHNFFPPSMFGNGTSTHSLMHPAANDGTRSPPKRKLRKARSLTNIFGVANNVSPQTVQGPSTATVGRPHAHSVTGADFPPMPIDTFIGAESSSHLPPSRDIFSDVMQWSAEGALYSSSVSASTDEIDSPLALRCPFGPGVTFDSPSYRPDNDRLTAPPVLREMQSFESGLTARVDPEPGNKNKLILRASSDREKEEPAVSSSFSLPARSASRIRASPSLETRMHSRYSTGVFDVLQSFRGLPLLDKLSQTSNETTVIKLSTRSEMSAAPKDDPRFVIWGDVHPTDDDGVDAMSLSHDSHTDKSSYSGPSRRSMKRKGSTSEAPQLRSTARDTPQKALIAATIERWIAQLTSELNYDELLIFFLTYRTYVSAVDLCHLLICRFHWAVEQSTSLHDDMVKKIVRVRTFIAIRYWLLTFFTVDFVPNRELRLLFANWLNTLGKDPTLGNTKDVLVSFAIPHKTRHSLLITLSIGIVGHCTQAKEGCQGM
jgi:Gdp/GTP exchange factor required for growth at low temperatures